MRVAVVLVLAVAAIIGLVGYSVLSGEADRCELFHDDLNLAVLEPTRSPDPDDRALLTYGTCSTIVTRTFDIDVPGWERHREHTIAGRLFVDLGDRRRLDATQAAARDDRSARVRLLPELGPGAFLVTRPEPAEEPDDNAIPDPAAALPLPATAYWMNDRGGFFSVSATRDGATVAQSQRTTVRLAELVDRRPVGPN